MRHPCILAYVTASRAATADTQQWQIGPLQDNGGPTQTHALLRGSEAIDATYSQGCIDENGIKLASDQRGALREVGVACDVGSFEYGSIVDVIFNNGFE